MICPEACREAAEQMAKLTPAQNEVVVLAAKGLTNQEIADMTGRAIETVASLMHAAFLRLKVTGRVEAAVIATKAGLV